MRRGYDTSTTESARLVASELVTNAHLHATRPGDPIDVRLYLSDFGPVIEVADPSDRMPAPADDGDALALRGRGLALVAALSRRWGANPVVGGGKVVYAVLAAGKDDA
ncbi:ATP-binding protein [Actinomadura rubteroloni]|nr:ATP-binding protein [Actinomadura rubteroloni]